MQRNTIVDRRPSRAVVWFVKVVATLGGFAWFGFLSLWMEYAYTRPTSRQPALGRLYALETHGHVVYLTHNEVTFFHGLGEIGMGLLLVATVVGLVAKRRSSRRDQAVLPG
jgi:hypothetical protein